MDDVRKYAMGTELTSRGPWSVYVSAKALCPDGKVRKVKRISICADTYTTIPASVRIRGKTVAGYVTVQTMQGFTAISSENDPIVVKFFPYKNRKNGNIFGG